MVTIHEDIRSECQVHNQRHLLQTLLLTSQFITKNQKYEFNYVVIIMQYCIHLHKYVMLDRPLP